MRHRLHILVLALPLLCSCSHPSALSEVSGPMLAALLVCHYLGDFCLTSKAMIKAKANGKRFFPILLHAGVHATLMAVALLVLGVSPTGCAAAFLIELSTHFVIDVLKGRLTAQVEQLRDNTRKPYWMLYGLDQLLHILVIVAIATMSKTFI